MLTDEQLAELNLPIAQGPDALWTLAEHKRILLAEVKQLREQVRVIRLLSKDEVQRAAYEAMDAERRGWQSRQAVENVTLAELRRDRDRFRDLAERALNLRMHGERALTGPTWRQWDTNAEKALRDTLTRGDGQC